MLRRAGRPLAIATAAVLALGGIASPQPGALPAASADYGPLEVKGVVTGSLPPGGISMTVAGGSAPLIAVSGPRDYQSGQVFYSDNGTSSARTFCYRKSNDHVYPGSETRESSGDTTIFSGSATSCTGSDVLSGIYASFNWGAPGDRFATNSFALNAYTPSYPGYDDIVSNVEVTLYPQQATLDSAYVTVVAAKLLAKYGADDVCLLLGEVVPTHASMSSVADATWICQGAGLVKALKFIQQTVGTLNAVMTLYEASQTTTFDPTTVDPECESVNSVGGCLDDDPPSGTDPEPEPDSEPAPADFGANIPPGSIGCYTPSQAAELLGDGPTGLPIETHHLASDKHLSYYTPQFLDFLSAYPTLSLNQSWNLLSMKHKGRHPNEYHKWVLDRMDEADAVAQGDPTVFVAEFTARVTDLVEASPLMIRAGYWKCTR